MAEVDQNQDAPPRCFGEFIVTYEDLHEQDGWLLEFDARVYSDRLLREFLGHAIDLHPCGRRRIQAPVSRNSSKPMAWAPHCGRAMRPLKAAK